MSQNTDGDAIVSTGIIKRIEKELISMDKCREEYILLSRKIIRACRSYTSRMINGGDIDMSEPLKMLDELREMSYSGDGMAYQEIAEVLILHNILKRKPLPDYEILRIPPEHYLGGLCDASGELKRYITNLLLNENNEEAEFYYRIMSDIYYNIREIVLPDKIVNIKKKTDVMRILVENTGDIILKYRCR